MLRSAKIEMSKFLHFKISNILLGMTNQTNGNKIFKILKCKIFDIFTFQFQLNVALELETPRISLEKHSLTLNFG